MGANSDLGPRQRAITFLPDGWVSSTYNPPTSALVCATPRDTLISFAVVNVLTLIGAFVLGHASIRYRLTCGLLKKPKNLPHRNPRVFLKPQFLLPAVAMLVLEITSAVVGAVLAHRTGSLTLQSLIMMALARPRGTWVTVVVHFALGIAMKRCGVIEHSAWMENYYSALFSMIVTEIVLEIIGIAPTIYLLGAARSGGLWSSALGEAHGRDVRILYVGAVVYVIGISVSLGITLSTIGAWVYSQRVSSREGAPGPDKEIEKEPATAKELAAPTSTKATHRASYSQEDTLGRKRQWFLWAMFSFGWISALGSWMIWAGFASLAQDM